MQYNLVMEIVFQLAAKWLLTNKTIAFYSPGILSKFKNTGLKYKPEL